MALKGGQSLEDKLYAFKYFISGQGISFVVLKATTSELVGPKRKHLNYLISMTNETNVSIPNLTKYLMQRAKHTEWSVSFKALITIHHLMSYGNERFIQNLASSTVNDRAFDSLANYMDRSCTMAYDMSTFLRRYSLYLNAKIRTYRSLGLDFCLLSSRSLKSEHSAFKDMSQEQLMTTLAILQEQFDSLIAFDASPHNLNNGIINAAFAALYKDFVKLYIAYQTAVLRLIELFFAVHHLRRAQELYEAYRKFLVRMDKVSDFMRVIDSVGMDKSDLPNLSKAPIHLSIHLLERRLKQLEPANKMKRLQSVDSDWCHRTASIEPPVQYCGKSSAASATSLPRRRSSLMSSSGSRAVATVPGELPPPVPRLKSPEARKKQKQPRTIPRLQEEGGTQEVTGGWPPETNALGRKSAERKVGTGGEIDCDFHQEASVASSSSQKLDQGDQVTSITTTEAMDLLLDLDRAEQQQPDLILMNEDCASTTLIAVRQPSDWVQVG